MPLGPGSDVGWRRIPAERGRFMALGSVRAGAHQHRATVVDSDRGVGTMPLESDPNNSRPDDDARGEAVGRPGGRVGRRALDTAPFATERGGRTALTWSIPDVARSLAVRCTPGGTWWGGADSVGE